MEINNFMPKVTVEEFTMIIERNILNQLYRPIFGIGKGGIGKTDSIEELAQKLNIGYVDIRLLLYTESDLKGIPYVNKEHTSTIWLQNDILPKSSDNDRGGILVFDEITSCSKSLRTAAYQLLNERRLGEYILPDNWFMVCLGNGEEDGGQFEGMEGNFANRCSVFNVVATTESWKKWAYKQNVNDLIIAYINWKPSDLHTYNPEKEEEFLFASPRSWKAVSDIINIFGYDENDRLTNAQICSNLGQLVGGYFMSFCRLKDKAINIDDILAGKDIEIFDNSEVIYITLQTLVKTMQQLLKDTQNNPIPEDTIEKCVNGFNFILNKIEKLEVQVMAIRDFIEIDKNSAISLILNDPTFKSKCPTLLEFANQNKVVFLT